MYMAINGKGEDMSQYVVGDMLYQVDGEERYMNVHVVAICKLGRCGMTMSLMTYVQACGNISIIIKHLH